METKEKQYETTELIKKVRQLNRESLKHIAEVLANSGIVDKTAIGLILTKIAFGIIKAEDELEKKGE